MKFPNLSIPENANWFYVSDSYTITIVGPTMPHYPGVMNSNFAMGPNQDFTVWIKSCSFELVPFCPPNYLEGINTDIQIGIYRVDLGSPVFEAIVGFSTPYGGAGGVNAEVLNSVTSLSGNTPVSRREFGIDAPLLLRGGTPNDSPTAQYQIGAAITFHGSLGGVLCAYQYHIHGAIL